MGQHSMAAFGEIERATRDNPQWGHPSGVNAYVTIVYHGPKKIRQQIREIGLDIFGTGEHAEGNFAALDRIFKGLSSTDTPEHIVQEVKRRLQEAMKPVRKVQPPPASLASFGPATPPSPVIPKNSGNNSTPLGPYRKRP
jgi:hypothetical protein